MIAICHKKISLQQGYMKEEGKTEDKKESVISGGEREPREKEIILSSFAI